MTRATVFTALVLAAAIASPAIADDDAYSQGRAAAERHDYKAALRLYQEAYDGADSKNSKETTAAWAAHSAALAGRCVEYRRWLSLTNKENKQSSMLRKVAALCPELQLPPLPPPNPCGQGKVLTEDKLHCCPEGTTLSADKLSCLLPTIDTGKPPEVVVQPTSASGSLIIESDLSGALLSGVASGLIVDGRRVRLVPSDGFHLPRGAVKLEVTAGTYNLNVAFPKKMGLNPMARQVTVPANGEAHESFDWRPQWTGDPQSWERFANGNRTPASYNSKVGYLFLGLGLLVGSASLYGTCGANVNGSCDATWQKGLSYTGATLGGLFGLTFTMVSSLLLAERRPLPYTDANDKPLP